MRGKGAEGVNGRTQYRIADDSGQCCRISRTMIFGKLFNTRWSIERTRRDHGLRVDCEKLASASKQLHGLLSQVKEVTTLEELRGLEGVGASAYFGVFDEMILGDKDTFSFQGRSRRPPLDAVNAMLSFAYSLLAHDCASALESVGLDSYVGFLHRDRPGRKTFLKHWQEKKKETLTHPYLGEKLSWGMPPYIQALLLARYLRGDLDTYPPFLWK